MPKIKKIYVGTNQVRPKYYELSVDFRNNSQANLQSEWWTFSGNNSPSLNFSADGLKVTNNSWQSMVWKNFDTSNFNKVHFEWSGYLSNNGGTRDGWIILKMCVPVANPVTDNTHSAQVMISRTTYSSQRGFNLGYNDNRYWTWTTQSAWEYTWYMDIDFTTWAISWVSSDGASLSGTLTAEYIGYLKANSVTFWVFLDGRNHIIHTAKIILS